MQVHLLYQAYIRLLLADETFIKVSSKYFDWVNIFAFDLMIELPNNTGINKYVIKLVEGKQPLYGPIYSLEPVALKTFKTYIKTFLKVGFIWALKSLTDHCNHLFQSKVRSKSLRLC